MTTTIGRFTTAECLRSFSEDGNRVRLAVNLLGDTTADVDVLRQQILGLDSNEDEPVVPITSTDDPTIDGFYRITGASLDIVRPASKNVVRANVDAIRIGGGFAKPSIETVLVAPGRDTVHTNAFDAYAYLFAVPKDLDYSSPAGWTSTFSTSVPSDTGDLLCFARGSALPDASTAYVFGSYARPDRHYRGAATIEVLRGSNWSTIVGRQLPDGVDRWRISNGLIRLSLTASPLGRILLEVFDEGTGSYEDVGTLRRGVWVGNTSEYDFGTVTAASDTEYTLPVILRNDPSTVVVRVPQEAGGSETYRLHSGRWGVDLELVRFSAVQHALWFEESGTALSSFSSNYGIRRSSNDSNGNRWFVASSQAITELTTQGGIYLSSAATSLSAIVGAQASIVSVSIPDADASISAYLNGHSLRSRVVAR